MQLISLDRNKNKAIS